MVDPRNCVRFQGGVPDMTPQSTPACCGGVGFGRVSSEVAAALSGEASADGFSATAADLLAHLNEN